MINNKFILFYFIYWYFIYITKFSLAPIFSLAQFQKLGKFAHLVIYFLSTYIFTLIWVCNIFVCHTCMFHILIFRRKLVNEKDCLMWKMYSKNSNFKIYKYLKTRKIDIYVIFIIRYIFTYFDTFKENNIIITLKCRLVNISKYGYFQVKIY